VRSDSRQVEFGDFQTPAPAAARVIEVLRRHRIRPATVIEPTCGLGNILRASLALKPRRAFGFDLIEDYLAAARASTTKAVFERRSFFDVDWKSYVSELPQPVLFVGNPPWVTNSALGKFSGQNLPAKKNSGLRGLDALTGKSNFDISEWMICRMLEAIQGTRGRVAMLCKTSVARKVLKFAHEAGLEFSDAHVYAIDSRAIFSVTVDACLFIFGAGACEYSCRVYPSLDDDSTHRFGFVNSRLVANMDSYSAELDGISPFKWRSGLKHDCSAVMELRDGVNGREEKVQIEREFVYPLLKSSDLSKKRFCSVIVTQKSIGEDTARLRSDAPKLWKYLSRNKALLAARKSSIYKGKPPFSIFGIGDYSFAPWKVAISGLYKQSQFTLVGPLNGKPVMLDDTCYFLPFETEKSARAYCKFLNSAPAQDFIRSIVFWDAKRPINAELLQRVCPPSGATVGISRNRASVNA